jgi:sugar phosphate isomerase/epimerase
MGGMMYQSWKHRYPFRLATTSFIFPAGYSENVRRLAAWVDEVELLLLECDHLPDPREIHDLRRLADTLDITYNVHLPMDVALGSCRTTERHRSVTALVRALERVAPLTATTHTLHLTADTTDDGGIDAGAWQLRCMDSLSQLMQRTQIQSHRLSVETLEYDPGRLAPIVETLDLAVCIDIGHLIRYGHHLDSVISRFIHRTSVFHLHGVAAGNDHRSLNHLDDAAGAIMAPVLEHFEGSVCLEVFNLQDLADSFISLAALVPSAGACRQKRDNVG